MRKQYSKILKTFFYHNLIQTRAALGITQEQMAEALVMDIRSYINLDHGQSCCSALTLSLFLIYYCSDVDSFLKELKEAFENESNDIA